jgi:hypothetical protein
LIGAGKNYRRRRLRTFGGHGKFTDILPMFWPPSIAPGVTTITTIGHS